MWGASLGGASGCWGAAVCSLRNGGLGVSVDTSFVCRGFVCVPLGGMTMHLYIEKWDLQGFYTVLPLDTA